MRQIRETPEIRRGPTVGNANKTEGAGGFDNRLYGTGAGSNR
ncbi:hypothetical protein P3T16_003574 [Paraburkholderia sp. GAS42]|jgi:hypothetical protein